eukprot:s381_g36.t1
MARVQERNSGARDRAREVAWIHRCRHLPTSRRIGTTSWQRSRRGEEEDELHFHLAAFWLYLFSAKCEGTNEVMLGGQSRRRLRPLALPLTPLLLLSLTQVSLPSFVGAPRTSITRDAILRQAADKGFGSGAKAPKKKKSKQDASDEETSIVKDKKSSKSKALSKQRLSDLRDKTLALRQKREEELDEYEMGKAMIAKYGREVAVMPQNVAERVAKRGMVIGGSFYATMLAVFAFGIILFKTQEIVIPPTLMAFVTLALLALAIFGGSYGMMSASWDPDKEGSALGAEEFGDNMKILGEGFRKATLQTEYEKALEVRNERRKLLEAKEKKKQELLNKHAKLQSQAWVPQRSPESHPVSPDSTTRLATVVPEKLDRAES